jgi:hypothetical protein
VQKWILILNISSTLKIFTFPSLLNRLPTRPWKTRPKRKQQILPFLLQASGGNDCNIHIAGGALFWCTIMTTIGWGNAAPVTDHGKMLVYVFGFISIVAFAALISTAGYVIATIVDDLFLRRGMRYMTQGLPAILFWFCALLGWMLVLALWGMNFANTRYGTPSALKDSFWT